MADIDRIEADLYQLDLPTLFVLETLLRQIISKKAAEAEADILARHDALLEEATRFGFSLVKRRGHRKYRNPLNQEEIWTGHGKRPKWLVAAIQNGQKLEEMEIKDDPAEG